VPGVQPAQVTVLGAGVRGARHALQVAVGMGARVIVLDKNIDRLRALDLVFGNRITTLYSNADAVEESVLAADLVIGGVLIPGAAAPKLVTREMIARMKKGAVVVDVAIDQGGCFETSHATTHASRRTSSTASSTTASPNYARGGRAHAHPTRPSDVAEQRDRIAPTVLSARRQGLAGADGRGIPYLKAGLNGRRGPGQRSSAVAKILGYAYTRPYAIADLNMQRAIPGRLRAPIGA
jgi:alanine dehydrogenase